MSVSRRQTSLLQAPRHYVAQYDMISLSTQAWAENTAFDDTTLVLLCAGAVCCVWLRIRTKGTAGNTTYDTERETLVELQYTGDNGVSHQKLAVAFRDSDSHPRPFG